MICPVCKGVKSVQTQAHGRLSCDRCSGTGAIDTWRGERNANGKPMFATRSMPRRVQPCDAVTATEVEGSLAAHPALAP